MSTSFNIESVVIFLATISDRFAFVRELVSKLNSELDEQINCSLQRLQYCAEHDRESCEDCVKELYIYYGIRKWLNHGCTFTQVAAQYGNLIVYEVSDDTLLWVNSQTDFCAKLGYALRCRTRDVYSLLDDHFIEYSMFTPFERSVWHKDHPNA